MLKQYTQEQEQKQKETAKSLLDGIFAAVEHKQGMISATINHYAKAMMTDAQVYQTFLKYDLAWRVDFIAGAARVTGQKQLEDLCTEFKEWV